MGSVREGEVRVHETVEWVAQTKTYQREWRRLDRRKQQPWLIDGSIHHLHKEECVSVRVAH